MGALTTKTFWVDTAERAVKTFAQSAVATILASDVLGVLQIDVLQTLSIAGLATLLSVLTSIGSAGSGDSKSASLVVEAKGLK